MSSVHQAWSAVMQDVQGIAKTQEVTTGPARFRFRGIDQVMSAVGPALRAHGVSVVPTAEHIDLERYQTAKGGLMQGAIVRMRYTVYGPDGDHFDGAAYGQAADAGDKAVSKAQSVAYRMFLLQALTIPTDEPDPDYEVHERVDPLVAAKKRLADVVQAAGIELPAFMAWAASEAGIGADIRAVTDVELLDGLTRRVEADGAAIVGVVS